MDRIRIRGGRGLRGTVRVSGSKNGALPILAASLLVDGPIVLRNMPRLTDIENMLRILGRLGVVHHWREDGVLEIEAKDKTLYEAPYDLVRTMRASFVVLGPLWARRGCARVSYPGGCALGHRPVDLHIKGIQDIGGTTEIDKGYVTVTGRPRGGAVFLGGNMGSTVLGTANVVMAATLATGTTYIESAAMEPEVEDLCRFLNACGARIRGIGSHLLVVEGVDTLHGCEWTMIPDRIEAGTFLCGAIMMNSDVVVQDCEPMHLLAVLDRLKAAGAEFEVGNNFIRNLPTPGGRLRAVDVTTMAYPGFPTDLQAQFMALMARADGVSVITEKIYPERFIHAAELARLGARIRREGATAIIEGTEHLRGAPVMASDLRASASLVLAGLVAEGSTDVRRVYHIDRGYERIEEKLHGIGADIERISEG
ncbi:MAG: UDP-N-acetylglucosamine 1-carboxyvinyltransferase [Planctomycetes bacterium]|nr:UDP-N-acetylglucosamine 1-carboxyvinyltransferase [Planctomycetota bacterium]MBZ0152168.1 UDP-N-acetylglucosamine 1-carboxyvinyltransferase [Planctomycetota bacterium]MCC7396108.1 UDP-N-acetylglucosamine 1-carboxyvinyltransferase [Planctomycetota bacterium]